MERGRSSRADGQYPFGMAAVAPDRPVLRAGSAEVEVSAADGGRISRLVVDGWDVLVREAGPAIGWGCYPMIPWAGRLRDATLRWRDGTWTFPATKGPHAIHGTLLYQPWRVIGAGSGGREVLLSADLVEPWPFGGRAVQRLALEADSLTSTIEVHATREAMPVIVGWHPWFLRTLRRSDGKASSGVELVFDAPAMLVADPPGIPTGRRIPPPPGPWDDTFEGLVADPIVRWPGALEIQVRSAEATHWVVYTGEPTGVCVEPQTGPPNGLNGGPLGEPRVIEPGEPLIATMSWEWRSPT